MIGSTWSEFIDYDDNLVLSRLMGLGHDRKMARIYGNSNFDNKYVRFKRERKLKYDLSIYFMIFLTMYSYEMSSNASNFKWHWILVDDETEWNGKSGRWNIVIKLSKDTVFHDIKGIYEYKLYFV